MTLRQLEILVAVADMGSISAAAEFLGVSQPSITNQMRAFEEELGCALLNRGSRGVTLTSAGFLAVARARTVLEEAAKLPREIDLRREELRGTVTLGVTPLSPVSVHHFPPMYQSFHRSHPEVYVEVIEVGSALLGEQVRKGMVDLALMPLPVFTTRLQFDVLWREELVIIAGMEDPLLDEPVTLTSLRERKFVFMKPGFGLTHTVSRLAQYAGFVPRVIQEVSSMSAMMGFVAAGIGLAIVPWESVMLEVRAGHIRAIPLSPPAYRQLALVYRQDGDLTPAANALARTIREYGKRVTANANDLLFSSSEP